MVSSATLPVPKVSTLSEIGCAHDHVRELHLEPIGEASLDHVLRDIAGRVCGRAVDLRRVLAAEGATAVTRITAVRVDDDLAAGEPRVAHRSAMVNAPVPFTRYFVFESSHESPSPAGCLLADLIAETLIVDAGRAAPRDDGVHAWASPSRTRP